MEEDFCHDLTRAGRGSEVDLHLWDLQGLEGFPFKTINTPTAGFVLTYIRKNNFLKYVYVYTGRLYEIISPNSSIKARQYHWKSQSQ